MLAMLYFTTQSVLGIPLAMLDMFLFIEYCYVCTAVIKYCILLILICMHTLLYGYMSGLHCPLEVFVDLYVCVYTSVTKVDNQHLRL